MSALRYLLALPRPTIAGDRQLSLANSPADACGIAPAIWCSEPPRIFWSNDRRTITIGRLFEQTAGSRAVELTDADHIPASPEVLIRDYWGIYLSLTIERSGITVLRDPTGMMPCYLRELDDMIIIASDMGTLAAAGVAPVHVDWDRLSEFLQAPGIRRRATCLSKLEELPPGVLTTFNPVGRSEQIIWTPWKFADVAWQIPPEQAVGVLRDAVCLSIAALAGGYRNIIVGMSGGLDSSIVCAALADAEVPFTALTMYTADPSGDERSFAKLVADRTGAPLHTHQYAAERIDLGKSASAHLPRPVGRTFMQDIEQAYLAEVSEHGFDAILTGNGGDNVFCYLHSAAPIVDRLRTAGGRRGVAKTFIDMCEITQCDAATMARATLSALARSHRRRSPLDMRLLNGDRRVSAPNAVLTPYLDQETRFPGKRSHIDMITRIQNHVEGYDRHRLPPAIPVLLAQPIVETCLRIPTWEWCRGGINRAIAREAFAAFLPQQIIARRSKSGPESLTAEVFELGRESLREMLLGGVLRDSRIIDAVAVEAAFDDPAVAQGQMLFRLLELAEAEAWARLWR